MSRRSGSLCLLALFALGTLAGRARPVSADPETGGELPRREGNPSPEDRGHAILLGIEGSSITRRVEDVPISVPKGRRIDLEFRAAGALASRLIEVEWIGTENVPGRWTGNRVSLAPAEAGPGALRFVARFGGGRGEGLTIERTVRFVVLDVAAPDVRVGIEYPDRTGTPPIDLNGDFVVDAADLERFWETYGADVTLDRSSSLSDWDGDSRVDLPDLIRFVDTYRAWEGREVGPTYGGGLVFPVTADPRGDDYSFAIPAPLFVARTDPQGLEGWVEWHFGDRVEGGDRVLSRPFAQPGRETVGVGVFGSAIQDSRDVTAYTVTIWDRDRDRPLVSDADLIGEGVPVRLEARTNPPGFESYVNWFASTKYGSASRSRGRGAAFEVRFDRTWGPDQQWLGVQADDAYFNQDQKFDALISAFLSTSQTTANSAYATLYNLEVSSIGPLLKLTGNPGTFWGDAYQDELSSRAAADSLPIPLVAIYLVDAILLGDPDPHYTPTLFDDAPHSPEVTLSLAINAYDSWWSVNQGHTLEELRMLPHPLEGTGIRWNGPILFVQAAPGVGDSTGAGTPFKPKNGGGFICESMPDGPDPGGAGDPYAWVTTPKDVGGPRPYNCLAWAIACHTDRWMETFDRPGERYTDVLTHYGYSTAPVDCAGQCPAGKGPKVKFISHVKIPEDPFHDSKWVHVMKQEADGDWTSKNGQGGLWSNISDCNAFVNKHYPPPNGQIAFPHCYCRN